MDGDVGFNAFLAGNYGPVHSEDDFELTVRGEIPAGLRGTLYRNGPNPHFTPHDPNHHWFLGDGMIHAFRLEDGKATYRNRYVRTPKWELENREGRSLFGAWGNPMTTDPLAQGQESGVANTNIVFHAGKLIALEEGHAPFEIAPRTLEPKGYLPYGGRVTAHPKLDPRTREMVWFAYGVGPMPLSAGVSYGVTDKTGKVVRREEFQAPYSSMIHDFMVTENHILLPVLPLTGSLERAMSGRPAYAWEPEKGAFVGVMRRDGDPSSIRWFNTEACYVFHPMNAYEADGKIIADVCRYDTAPGFPNADGSPGRETGARLVRWTFDLAGDSDAIREEPLDDLTSEFPRFDERFAGLAYRHGYYAAGRGGAGFVNFNAIAHLDLATGARQVHDLGPDVPSEPVFTPRSPEAAEGDGWLTAVIYRAVENRSDLVVYDAQAVAKGPIAVAELPRRVPFGFHGNWVAD